MKKAAIGMFILLLTSMLALAQQEKPPVVATPTNTLNAEERLRFATSTGAYPVTPGDVYKLTFQQGPTPSTLEIQVGSDYTIQLNIFGKVNAAGMAFAQVKQTIEKAFVAAYPRSTPSLAISSVGVFQVFLKGETPEAQNVDAWGMASLSDIVRGRLGPYSCLRNIKIISGDGTEKEYDLFQYQRLGPADQNPYMKAGDTVVIFPSERTVEIAGEIKRPGKYQLLPPDGIQEMIESYGGGLTTAAETSRLRIDRVSGEKARTFYVNLQNESDAAIPLEDGDLLTVPSKTATLPVVFFEGAVISETPPGPAAAPAMETSGLFAPVNYNRIPYRFRQGETLTSALAAVRSSISPMANLSSALLIREGVAEAIPLDLAALLSGAGVSSDITLLPLDRIVIPTAQFFVAVYGEVTRPGNYPYTPAKRYRHYADLAGFSDIEEIPKNIVILDSRGKRRDVQELIEPGSRIYLTAARVTVQGAVLNPGNFTYRRDFAALDYENLAGGFDPERSTNKKITVFDPKGVARRLTDSIQPGDRVYVEADKFEYNFGKGLPIFLSVVTAVTSIVTMYALLR
jgi:protein involved in polysaccharide export with SLBB domain